MLHPWLFTSSTAVSRSSGAFSLMLQYLCFAVTIQVNVAKARGYLFANIPISLVTFAINLWAAISILRKERTGIHCLIVCDCVLNVVSSLHTSFLQSPWSLLGSSIPCLFSLIALNLLTAWNRLVPVAIAAFRYIMVCHAVFVQKHGGGKKVGWQWPPKSLSCVSKNITFWPGAT